MSNYTYITKSVFIIIFCILLFSYAPSVGAVETNRLDSLLKISPVLLKISLEPGSKQIYTVAVENRTNSPMPIRATVEGFDPSDEETGYSPKPSEQTSPLSTWISLDKNESIIPAKSTEYYSIKIAVPSSIAIGGYYAIIYFSPIYPGTSVSSKIGVIALANIGILDTADNKANISQFSFDTPLYEKNPLTTHIRITNSALHYFSAKPKLTISPFWGKSDSVELDEKILLPGKSRTWKSVFSIQNSKWGIYKAILEVSLENGENISKTIPVAVLPLRLFLWTLFASGVLILLWKKRSNISTALYVLFHGTTPRIESVETVVHTSEPKLQTEFHKPDPQHIIDVVKQHNGNISLAAKTLGIDRTTVYRWVTRAKKSSSKILQRKSTKPHTLRKSILSPEDIHQIIQEKKLHKLSPQEIVQKLHLSVSARTVFRILQSHKLTQKYKQPKPHTHTK